MQKKKENYRNINLKDFSHEKSEGIEDKDSVL